MLQPYIESATALSDYIMKNHKNFTFLSVGRNRLAILLLEVYS